MEREWAASAFPPEATVLNLRLRPYSCGHEILLCKVGSPIILGSVPSWNDLFVAALICSLRFKDGLEIVSNPTKWNLQSLLWRIALKLNRSLLLPEELAKFRAYLNAGSWSPPTYELKTGYQSRSLIAPRAYRLIPFLCSKLNIPESDALDFPMARANAYKAAELDESGSIVLEGSATDKSVIDHLAEMESRAAKGEKVWDF